MTVFGANQARRGFLRAACRQCLGMGGLFSGLQALADDAPPAAANAAPAAGGRFARPAMDTDEGGLWAMMDREEAKLRRSPFSVRDPALTRYVQDIACRLAGDHCPDIRVYVVRTPLFNASMAPNGMMQVWTGLLLRVENEAQLAAVMGHEIGHYLERHSLERMRDIRSRTAFAQFMGMFGLVGALAQLGTLAGAFAFSREQESQADQIGMRLMKKAGYNRQQAAVVWDNLLGELKVTGGDDAGKRSPMMATHPPVENRRNELLRLAGDASGISGQAEYRVATSAGRMAWLQDDIRRGQFEESLVLFNRMLVSNPQDVQVLYARGEVYRQRAGKQDLQDSLADLERATLLKQPPPEAFRALGLVQKQQANAAGALQSFEKYLAAAPDAADAGLIRNYIAELKP